MAALSWAYSSGTKEIPGAPLIATNRTGAWPESLELAMRVRNLEMIMNRPPVADMDYLSVNNYISVGQEIGLNERPMKAFMSAFKNLGGGKYKDALTEPGGWSIGMMGFGEMLPDETNKVTLDKTKKDKWGLNVLNIDCELKDNEIKMRKDILEDAKEMLERAGAKNVQGFEGDGTPGRGIHEMGTARMGRDPKTSVLNGNNQVWDAPNVFVTDGSFMTSANCVNPSLTYMAFTARAVDFAVSELKKGNL